MDAPIKKYEVINAFFTGPEDARVNYEVGAVVEFVDNEEFAAAVAEGNLKEVVEAPPVEEPKVAEPAPVVEDEIAPPPAGPVLTFRGQVVLRDGMRTESGREYHHITLANGESMDVTDEEYAEMLAQVA